MTRTSWLWLFSAMLLAVPLARAGAPSNDITVTVDSRGSTVIIDVDLTIDVPAEEAWPTLIDYDHMAEFIPNLSESRVISRDGNRMRILQKGRAARGPFSFSFENVREVEVVPPSEIRTKLVSGTLKSAESVTRIEHTPSGIRLLNHGEYTVSESVPVSLVRASIASETRENFALMRAEIMRRHAPVASVH